MAFSIAWPGAGVEPRREDAGARDGLAVFRRGLYRCFTARADALFELADAVPCSKTSTSQHLAGFAAENKEWLRIYRLPAYAPDLNPAEGIWSLLKRSMVNFAAAALDGLVRIVKRKLKKIQYRPHLVGRLPGRDRPDHRTLVIVPSR